jgi:hypothetical protein
MACTLLWGGSFINGKKNLHYPMLIQTPGGQNISNISYLNYTQGAGDDLIPVDIECDRQPKLIFYGINEDQNIKKHAVSSKSSNLYYNFENINARHRLELIGDNGEGVVKTDKILVNDFVEAVTNNVSGSGFCSFVMSTATVTLKPYHLFSADIRITMSDGYVIEYNIKYMTPTQVVVAEHANASAMVNKIFYTQLIDRQPGGAIPDDQIISNIMGAINTIYPSFDRSCLFSSRKKANTRRRRVNAREGGGGGDTGDEGGGGYTGDEGGDDDNGPPKRKLMERSAFTVSTFQSTPQLPNTSYIIVPDVGRAGVDWEIDNIETSVVVGGNIRLVGSPPPDSLMKNLDMFMSKKYGDIVSEAERKAVVENDMIIWFTIEKMEIVEEETAFILEFTLSKPGTIITVTTNTITLQNVYPEPDQRPVITSLHNYYRYGTTNPAIIMKPAIEPMSFLHFVGEVEPTPGLYGNDSCVDDMERCDGIPHENDISPFADDDWGDLLSGHEESQYSQHSVQSLNMDDLG